MALTDVRLPVPRPGRVAAALLAVLLAACSSNSTTGAPGPSTTDTPASSSPPASTVPIGSTPSTTASTIGGATTNPGGFDDHTVAGIASTAQFRSLARSGTGASSVVKFSIPLMAERDDVLWLDSNFYEVHDEWYWFRLLNGEPVPGFDTEPVAGLEFATIADVYDWASQQVPADLPLDLRFIDSRTYGNRLYSDDFYRLGFTHDVRNYGLGSVIEFPDAADGDTHWLFELEFSDSPTPAEVARYFELLSSTLPPEIADRLEWVLRSPAQEAVAAQMKADRSPYHDRIVRYRDLVPAGRVEVYNPGLTAGRLLLVDGVDTTLADATESDIVVVENVPDFLPPARALITSSPQTPLAHVNLLARNRGIPNASQSGILDDAGLRQAARVRARAVVSATADGELEIVLIDPDEYDAWQSLLGKKPIAVPAVDRTTMPLVVDLSELAATVTEEAEVERWRPIIGGKSAGFLSLLSAPGVTTPERPLAITVAPYLEHLDQVADELDAMLTDPDFVRSARVRFLFLEGPDDYVDFYPTVDDTAVAMATIGRHPPGTPLGDILEAGGFQRYFRDRPIDPATLDAITQRLVASYGDYADTQGLRFRSSSSVEDIEGFTGAGLYDSNTGFLAPDLQPDEDDHDKTVEDRIKKTWSSYWGFEAFEERELERVDHRSGAMGVLVHARFDDALEDNNGVATFTLLPAGMPDQAVAMVNVQVGDESVANPDPSTGELPEVVEVRLGDDGSIRVERLATSTLADGADVLTDDALTELFAQLESVTELWRERVNASLTPSQAVETVTLDFEFKTMAPGWPARRDGTVEPGRLVVKQARSLDPGLRRIAETARELPVPRDGLARARRIEQVTCPDGDDDVLTRVEITTDRTILPDLGFSETPYVAEIRTGVDIDETCRREVVFVSPEDFLVELLETGTVLDLT